jgi:Glycosyltransferase family 87
MPSPAAQPQLRPVSDRSATRLPPVWLSASALAAAITVVFGVLRWIDHFQTDPAAQDLSLHQVAARIGLAHGWSHIYDIELQRQAAAGLSPQLVIDSMHLFISPPPTAWMLAPLAGQPPAVSYLLWTVISVAALIGAGWLVIPGPTLPRLTVILVSLAIYPMHYEFWQGQTVVATLALLGLSYWLLERDRWIWCGLAMAAAFCFKPQDALLVPVALLVSGRWRPVAVFAAAGLLIALVFAASLGTSGIASWLGDLSIVHADPHNAALAYSFVFGQGPLASFVEALLGVGALALAWSRRDRLDLVFCLGLVGTTMSAPYLHEHDISILVLGAWIVLGARPSAVQRVWLLMGIVAAQVIAIGQPIPMLLWEPLWMVLLALEPRLSQTVARQAARTA